MEALAGALAGAPREAKPEDEAAAAALARAEETAHAVRQRRLVSGSKCDDATGGGGGRWDWSKSYEVFDDWVAEDEYQERVRAREEAEAARMGRGQHIGGCNHDHSAERELVEKSTAAKLADCARFRMEGGAWFEEGQFYRASERFRRVMIWLDYTFPETEEERRSVEAVQLPALVNLGVCCLRLGDFAGVLEHSRLALELDARCTKALYCRAKALRLMAEYEEAAEVLRRALDVEPDSVELRKEFALLGNSVRTYQADAKAQAQAMFGELSSSSSSPSPAASAARRPARPEGNDSSALSLLGPRDHDALELDTCRRRDDEDVEEEEIHI